MHKRSLLVCLLAIVLLPVSAAAQERGQVGLVMGFPSTFGFIWHASDSLAIRPEVNFSHASSESESSIFGLSSSGENDALQAGTSVLWYLRKFDNVRTYVAPRVTFIHTSSKSSGSSAPVTSNGFLTTVTFGAQYSPVRKFSVFGEVGYGFSRATSKLNTPISSNKTTARSWSARSIAGVVFYFGK